MISNHAPDCARNARWVTEASACVCRREISNDNLIQVCWQLPPLMARWAPLSRKQRGTEVSLTAVNEQDSMFLTLERWHEVLGIQSHLTAVGTVITRVCVLNWCFLSDRRHGIMEWDMERAANVSLEKPRPDVGRFGRPISKSLSVFAFVFTRMVHFDRWHAQCKLESMSGLLLDAALASRMPCFLRLKVFLRSLTITTECVRDGAVTQFRSKTTILSKKTSWRYTAMPQNPESIDLNVPDRQIYREIHTLRNRSTKQIVMLGCIRGIQSLFAAFSYMCGKKWVYM